MSDINLNGLEHGKDYMVRLKDGNSARLVHWDSRTQLLGGFGERGIDEGEVLEIRGPIRYYDLPIVMSEL